MQQNRLCAKLCWSAKTFKASIFPKQFGFRSQAPGPSWWWTQGSVIAGQNCFLSLMAKVWSEFLWGTKGALNPGVPAWRKEQVLADSHCSNLLFSNLHGFARMQACELSWICWLLAQKLLVQKQVRHFTLGIYITKKGTWLGGQSDPNQVQQRDLDSEEAVVKRMAATNARVLPSDTATIAHTQGAQMLVG